jgi:putative phage-type endonuclease
MDRDEWLKFRQAGIGASEIAAVAGIDHYRSPLDVYLAKVNGKKTEDNQYMSWGRRLESIIVQAYEDETGRATRPSEPSIIYSQEWDRALCTPDRLVDGGRLLECKSSRSDYGWGPVGTEEIPPSYYAQVQWQLFCCRHLGFDVADVAALIGGSDFRIYEIAVNREFQLELLAKAQEFWDRVERREPPIDSRSSLKSIENLYQPSQGIEATLGDEAATLVDQYESIGDEIRSLESKKEELRAAMIVTMKDAQIGYLPDGRTIKRTVVRIPGGQRKESVQNRLTISRPKAQPQQDDLLASMR